MPDGRTFTAEYDVVAQMRRRAAARAPKRAICRLDAISVRAENYGRTFGRGYEVDLAEFVAPGLTLEQALGNYVTGFELLDEQR